MAKIEVIEKIPATKLFPPREVWKIGEEFYVAYMYPISCHVKLGDSNGNSFGNSLFSFILDGKSDAREQLLKSMEQG